MPADQLGAPSDGRLRLSQLLKHAEGKKILSHIGNREDERSGKGGNEGKRGLKLRRQYDRKSRHELRPTRNIFAADSAVVKPSPIHMPRPPILARGGCHRLTREGKASMRYGTAEAVAAGVGPLVRRPGSHARILFAVVRAAILWFALALAHHVALEGLYPGSEGSETTKATKGSWAKKSEIPVESSAVSWQYGLFQTLGYVGAVLGSISGVVGADILGRKNILASSGGILAIGMGCPWRPGVGRMSFKAGHRPRFRPCHHSGSSIYSRDSASGPPWHSPDNTCALSRSRYPLRSPHLSISPKTPPNLRRISSPPPPRRKGVTPVVEPDGVSYWIIEAWIGGAVGVFSAVACAFLPESPRWLIATQRINLQTLGGLLEYLEDRPERVSDDTLECLYKTEKARGLGYPSCYAIHLSNQANAFPILAGIPLISLHHLTFAALMAAGASPEISGDSSPFQISGFTPETRDSRALLLYCLVQVFMIIPLPFLLDHKAYRYVLWNTTLACLGLLAVVGTILKYMGGNYLVLVAWAWMGCCVAFAIGLGPLPLILIPELLSSPTRAVGSGVTSVLSWTLIFLFHHVIPIPQNKGFPLIAATIPLTIGLIAWILGDGKLDITSRPLEALQKPLLPDSPLSHHDGHGFEIDIGADSYRPAKGSPERGRGQAAGMRGI